MSARILELPAGDFDDMVAALADAFDEERHPPPDRPVGSRRHKFQSRDRG